MVAPIENVIFSISYEIVLRLFPRTYCQCVSSLDSGATEYKFQKGGGASPMAEYENQREKSPLAVRGCRKAIYLSAMCRKGFLVRS